MNTDKYWDDPTQLWPSEGYLRICTNFASPLLVALAIAGCQAPDPRNERIFRRVDLNPATLTSLKGETVAAIPRDRAHSLDLVSGRFNGPAAIARNAMVKGNDIENPAPYIAQHLVESLARDYGLRPLIVENDAASDDPTLLSKQYSGATVLLDIQTLGWGFAGYPWNPSRFRVDYAVELRLISTARGDLLAKKNCSRFPSESPEAPTQAELLQNGAARLKEELLKAADYCIKQFRTEVFREL